GSLARVVIEVTVVGESDLFEVVGLFLTLGRLLNAAAPEKDNGDHGDQENTQKTLGNAWHGSSPQCRWIELIAGGQLQRSGAFLCVANILLELAAKLADRLFHRPTGTISQAADRRTRHDADGVADLFQYIQVLRPPLPAPQPIAHFQHPAR